MTKALTTKKDKSLSWVGLGKMMTGELGEREKQILAFTAEAYQLPLSAINLLGGMPYLNKEASAIFLKRYGGSGYSVTCERVQIATKENEMYAIMVTHIKLKDGQEFDGLGEASPASIKLAAVKATPNMMAETRSFNRAIYKAFRGRVLIDLSKKLAIMNVPDDAKVAITQASQNSFEEMANQGDKQAPTSKTPDGKAVGLALDKIATLTTVEQVDEAIKKTMASEGISKTAKEIILGALKGRKEKLEGEKNANQIS